MSQRRLRGSDRLPSHTPRAALQEGLDRRPEQERGFQLSLSGLEPPREASWKSHQLLAVPFMNAGVGRLLRCGTSLCPEGT